MPSAMLTSILLVAVLVSWAPQPTVGQRLGLPIHKFFTNPFVRYTGQLETQVRFVGSEIYRLSLPHPVLFGPNRTAYRELFLHKKIPGFIFFKNPKALRPDVEQYKLRPYIKVLNEFRDRHHDEIEFYARSIIISSGSSCVDKKFANYYKDAANLVFTYPTTGYFSPQSIVAVTFRRPSGQAMGSLGEIVLVNSGEDTVAFINYGGLASVEAQSAGFFDVPESPGGSLSLPPGFVEQSNMAESGAWLFRLSHPTGISSAEVDQVMRSSLDLTAQQQGFLPNRLLGCPCSQCDRRASCLNIGSGAVRILGVTKCCRCQSLNSHLGNGQECLDTGRPVPVTYTSLSKGSDHGRVHMNASIVQTNLDVNIKVDEQSSNASQFQQTVALTKISEPVWGNLALLTAVSSNNSTQNLFALGDTFRRRVRLIARDNASIVAIWTIEQYIWNNVLLKATNTSIQAETISNALSRKIDLVIVDSRKLTTRYEFTSVQRDLVRVESLSPANYSLTVLIMGQPVLELSIEFSESWEFSPSCEIETRVGRLLLEHTYDVFNEPQGIHITSLVGNLKKWLSCDDLACGTGAVCVTDDSGQTKGQVRCQCLPGYRRQEPESSCRPICGPTLCDVNSECLLNKCICASGFSGDGLRCVADRHDCRLPQAACSEEGFACMQQATSSGVQHRCQCSSSKCIRETDAACRQQAGCSRFADCRPGNNGNAGTCVCRQGFRGNGSVCLPEICVDNATCADAGQFAFCNASRVCDTCPPPKTVAAGRCQARPCQPSDCSENALCDPVSNACVCRDGFAANRLGVCSIACRSLQDCNKGIMPDDMEILNATLECLSGVCQCRSGYTVDRLDQTAMTLTCTNCVTDYNCLRGATCQADIRFAGARLCKCPDGKYGDGKTACHECAPGHSGSSQLACGDNALCESRPDGRICRCQFGYASQNPKTTACIKEKTQLMIDNETEIRLYEGQTDQEITCRVLQGPVRPTNLIWTNIREVPLPVSDGNRVVQYVLNERKVLRFSRVVKSDALQYHCFPDVEGEYGATLTVNLTVLDNPCKECHPLAFCNYRTPGCQCPRGFSGDGVTRCDKASCVEQKLCDPGTELCLYSPVTRSYSCECVPGMERIQGRCQHRQEACSTPNVGCHLNAECALVDGRRQCRCREGFSGDGKLRCEPDGPGCNFYNRCVKNSECKYSQVDNRYRCVCSTGYFGTGDTECRTQASCSACVLNSGTCQQQTVEHRTIDGRVEHVQLSVCTCPTGSFKVTTATGATLCRTAEQVDRTLYIAQGDAILQMPAEDSKSEDRDQKPRLFIAMSSASSASDGPSDSRLGSPVVALDYNCHRKQLIWSVYGHSKLYKANTVDSDMGGPASSSWVPFGDGLENVEGLAVDWQTDNVYYTAQYVSKEEATRGERFGEIGVISYRQGISNKKVLFRGPKDGVFRPRGIAVDPFLGKIYYTDWDRNDPRIMMASMNGANHVKLSSTNSFSLPNDIVRRFDSPNEEVCYAHAEIPIKWSLLNITARLESTQTVVQCVWRPVPDAAYVEHGSPVRLAWSGEPFGLAYSDGDFYLANWFTNRVVGHNVNSNRTFVRGPLGSLDNRLMGVTVANSACPTSAHQVQSGEHPCADSRGYGDCKYICLAAPNQGVECVCPDNFPGCNPYINRPTATSRPGF